MSAVLTRESIEITRTYEVTGTEPINVYTGSLTRFVPDSVTIVRVNGIRTDVSIAGGQLLKDGSVSTKARQQRAMWRHEGDWPTWLDQLVATDDEATR